MSKTSCENCSYYIYNDDLGLYMCEVDMDEDDFYRSMTSSNYVCPYYRDEDEYFLARKQ